ncbi:unnamed protein product [Notodromas monacha]|uniref:Protein kinase domain-containing protein n=1 Tax=Notodromas monacha TaxID=399045 RepID=A0A7R9BFJ5_9CRUS|nr:unnamed protein product [Notodromas monacha]CAG0914486.1 unnamed protein product [Notodromas monacha]
MFRLPMHGLSEAVLEANGVSTKLVKDPNGNDVNHSKTWFAGFYTCLQPILDKMVWNNKPFEEETGSWEIDFSALSDLEYLASGAQGHVYKARYRDRVVAVKKVDELKDAYCMRKLSRHPNIVALFGLCFNPCCIVMEYCHQGSLVDFLREKRTEKLPLTRVVNWARQIAQGMAHLHSKKILHRDLKSANVLISRDSLKITDFGTSRDWSSVESNDSVFMTLAAKPHHDTLNNWTLHGKFPQGLPAVLYGVGNGSLHLPIPACSAVEFPTQSKYCSFPAGVELLLRLCWAPCPRNRPGFKQIIIHLDIAEREFKTDPNANSVCADVVTRDLYEVRLHETTRLFSRLNGILQRLDCSCQIVEGRVANRRRNSL